MLVREIMSSNVVTLSEYNSLKDAVTKFAEHNISGIPIVNDKQEVIGIVTEADILKEIGKFIVRKKIDFPVIPTVGLYSMYASYIRRIPQIMKEIGNTRISQIMTKNVVTILEDLLVEEILPLIIMHRIKRIPVINRDKKLVGIVARDDIIKYLSHEMR